VNGFLIVLTLNLRRLLASPSSNGPTRTTTGTEGKSCPRFQMKTVPPDDACFVSRASISTHKTSSSCDCKNHRAGSGCSQAITVQFCCCTKILHNSWRMCLSSSTSTTKDVWDTFVVAGETMEMPRFVGSMCI